MTAQRYLNSANETQKVSMERLSSGSRINSAKDDAAGLQISNRLDVQGRGLEVAVRNANDGISMAQTAEGAMAESTNILQRMRDLSLQASNGSNSQEDRNALQQEVSSLNDELNRIAETTSFGGQKLLNGTFGSRAFQIGANSGEAVNLTLSDLHSTNASMGGKSFMVDRGKGADWKVNEDNKDLEITMTDRNGDDTTINLTLKEGDDMQEVATYINGQQDTLKASVDENGHLQMFAANNTGIQDLDISGGFADDVHGIDDEDKKHVTVNSLNLGTIGGAQEAVNIIDAALQHVDKSRSSLGAFQNRFERSITNLDNIGENVAASKSRIKDTDFAKTTTAMTKAQILQQASTSILAQAKQSPAAALSLLG